MKHKLNLESWNRKDHFQFFNQFEEPFFGVTVNIDCTTAYKVSKEVKSSFFLYYLHKSLTAVNNIRPFKYRIENNDVVEYDIVNASPTINRPDGTFGFAYIGFIKDYTVFLNEAQKEIDKVQNSLGLVPAVSGENLIHYSSIPWLNFTSLSHARAFSFKDSIPKISFGKMTEHDGQKKMPVSIHVHHGLMDGYHLGEFVDLFQELMDQA